MAASEITFTIGSVTLNDLASWFLEEAHKALESPSPRQTKTARQGMHGINDSLSFYNERILPFKGTLLGSSQADRKSKQLALEAALSLPAVPNYASNDGYQLILITDEDGVGKQCYAKLLVPVSWGLADTAMPDLRTFSFVLMAKDSNLYSQTLQSQTGSETVVGTNFSVVQGVSPTIPFTLYQQTANNGTITNNGTIGSPPLITVNGPTSAPQIQNATTNKTMSFPGLTLLTGERLVINSSPPTSITKYTAANVASDASGYLDAVNSQWVIIEPGANIINLIDNSPDAITATIQVQFRDSYI